MLSENIRTIRKARGLSQQDLASRLNVVRQTVSKWEQGLSVPDSNLLIALSDVLQTPVSTLLGEPVNLPKADDIAAIAEKLETVNLQLARKAEARRRLLRALSIFVGAAVLILFVLLAAYGSPYLNWKDADPETVVFGAAYHAFEWLFVRLAPFVLIASICGICLTRKKG